MLLINILFCILVLPSVIGEDTIAANESNVTQSNSTAMDAKSRTPLSTSNTQSRIKNDTNSVDQQLQNISQNKILNNQKPEGSDNNGNIAQSRKVTDTSNPQPPNSTTNSTLDVLVEQKPQSIKQSEGLKPNNETSQEPTVMHSNDTATVKDISTNKDSSVDSKASMKNETTPSTTPKENSISSINSTLPTSTSPTPSSSSNVSSSSIPSRASSTATTNTTNSTTTKLNKKPSIVYSVEDHPELDEEVLKNKKIASKQEEASKLPFAEPPIVQPSQEFNSDYSNQSSRDYIVPVVTVIFTIPLVIGILITGYRRFKDFWSTRYYRRMDFLVDGMYDD